MARGLVGVGTVGGDRWGGAEVGSRSGRGGGPYNLLLGQSLPSVALHQGLLVPLPSEVTQKG